MLDQSYYSYMRIKCISLVMFVAAFSCPASAAEQGFLKQESKNTGVALTRHGAKCRINFTGKKLELSGDLRYARIEYIVGDDCSVTAGQTVYSTSTVKAVEPRPARGLRKSKVLSVNKGPIGRASTYGCTVNVWEEDFPGITMITMQNHTTWDADSGGLISARVDGFANPNLDWWWVNGDVFLDVGYVNPPHVGGSYAGASFYCDGSNFCRTCSTAGCGIALIGHFEFNSAGRCSGWGTFDGEIVPRGRFDYEVIR